MSTRMITYRDYADGPWTTEHAPGPLPQAHTRSYPTSRTHCTCGHAGPAHRRQTLSSGSGLDIAGRVQVTYAQGKALRYRGECSGHYKGDNGVWYRCRCSWFVEDLDYDLAEAYERRSMPKPSTQALIDLYMQHEG